VPDRVLNKCVPRRHTRRTEDDAQHERTQGRHYHDSRHEPAATGLRPHAAPGVFCQPRCPIGTPRHLCSEKLRIGGVRRGRPTVIAEWSSSTHPRFAHAGAADARRSLASSAPLKSPSHRIAGRAAHATSARPMLGTSARQGRPQTPERDSSTRS
jgi:hypothetical protein